MKKDQGILSFLFFFLLLNIYIIPCLGIFALSFYSLMSLVFRKFQQIVTNQFSRVAQNERCSFFGNVSLGSSITLPELREMYNAVRY